jgi:hypothetical protein
MTRFELVIVLADEVSGVRGLSGFENNICSIKSLVDHNMEIYEKTEKKGWPCFCLTLFLLKFVRIETIS